MFDSKYSARGVGATLRCAGKSVVVIGLTLLVRTAIVGSALLLLGCASDHGARPPNVALQQPPVFSPKAERSPELAVVPWDAFSLVVYKRTGTQPLIKLDKVRVNSGGEAILPLVGKVQVAGLTIPQLESRLHQLYNQELAEPFVQVLPAESRNRNVYVLGEVTTPKVLPVLDSVSVLELVLMAGGFTKDADRANIIVVRPGVPGTSADQGAVASANIAQLLKDAKLTQNVQVRAGDIVYVPPDNIAQRNRLFAHILTVMQPFIQAAESVAAVYVVNQAGGASGG